MTETLHKHHVEHVVQFPIGKVQEICSCGASRIVFKGKSEQWHTCVLCTHPYGLRPSDADKKAR